AEGRTLRLVKVDVAKGFGGGIITPSLPDGVGKITFVEGRGGTNRIIEVAKSDNEGLTWEIVTTLNGTEQCKPIEVEINDQAANRIRLESKGTGDLDLDDISVTKFVSTSVEEEIIPTEFSLNQNYPNPFNPSTTINFSLPKSSFVQLRVYDHLGREVSSLINNELPAGMHSVSWNAAENLRSLASGIYFVQLRADSFVKSIKAVLMK
ncbi:MAG: T9SS type A sorting domain-containing protein, partial [Ignavibacteria bacterium]|nr:T9SS type A sorting domain-containing protein [Ignavibacteria bacterium]